MRLEEERRRRDFLHSWPSPPEMVEEKALAASAGYPPLPPQAGGQPPPPLTLPRAPPPLQPAGRPDPPEVVGEAALLLRRNIITAPKTK